jgi:hypothetical protein
LKAAYEHALEGIESLQRGWRFTWKGLNATHATWKELKVAVLEEIEGLQRRAALEGI